MRRRSKVLLRHERDVFDTDACTKDDAQATPRQLVPSGQNLLAWPKSSCLETDDSRTVGKTVADQRRQDYR